MRRKTKQNKISHWQWPASHKWHQLPLIQEKNSRVFLPPGYPGKIPRWTCPCLPLCLHPQGQLGWACMHQSTFLCTMALLAIQTRDSYCLESWPCYTGSLLKGKGTITSWALICFTASLSLEGFLFSASLTTRNSLTVSKANVHVNKYFQSAITDELHS